MYKTDEIYYNTLNWVDKLRLTNNNNYTKTKINHEICISHIIQLKMIMYKLNYSQTAGDCGVHDLVIIE